MGGQFGSCLSLSARSIDKSFQFPILYLTEQLKVAATIQVYTSLLVKINVTTVRT